MRITMRATAALSLVGALITMALLAFIMPATASAAPETNAGAFCAKSDVGKIKLADNGDTIQCQKVGDHYRWVKIVVTPSSSSSSSKPTSPSASVSVSKSPSKSATATVTPSSSSTVPPLANAGLPLTGAPVPAILGVAGLLLALGVGAIVFSRRRRVQFRG